MLGYLYLFSIIFYCTSLYFIVQNLKRHIKGMGYRASPTLKQIACVVIVGFAPFANFIIGVLMMVSEKVYLEILRSILRNARKD